MILVKLKDLHVAIIIRLVKIFKREKGLLSFTKKILIKFGAVAQPRRRLLVFLRFICIYSQLIYLNVHQMYTKHINTSTSD